MKALIDLGTNTFNLMIADVDAAGQLHVIHSEKEGVALGMGGIHEKRLTDEAMDRAVNCLKRYKKHCQNHGVSVIRAIGTSAIRDAQNREVLIERVLLETGIQIEVITGLAEAQFIYQGVHQTMNFGNPGLNNVGTNHRIESGRARSKSTHHCHPQTHGTNRSGENTLGHESNIHQTHLHLPIFLERRSDDHSGVTK